MHEFNFSYYATDNDVLEDHEIQGFANEVSSDGLGSNGGQGKVLIYQPRFAFWYFCMRSFTSWGGRKGGPKTANRIGFFPEYRNRTYMEAHYMKADVTGLRNSNLRVIAAKEVLLELVHL